MKKTERILFVAGLLILGYLLWRFDWRRIFEHFEALGWGLCLLFSLEAGSKAINTAALWCLVPRRTVPFSRLFAATLAADAVNYMVPSGAVGGHALTARVLSKDLPSRESVALVTASGSAQVAAQYVFCLFGVVFMLGTPLRASFSGWFAVMMTFVSVCAVVLSVGIVSRGAYQRVWRLARRIWPGAPDLHEMLGEVDTALIKLYRERPKDLAAAVALYSAGWVWGAFEFAVLLHLLGIPFDILQILAVEAVAVFIDGVLFFMPAKAGTQEGGAILGFTLMGLPPEVGLTAGLIRRFREMIWAGIGYGLMLANWKGLR